MRRTETGGESAFRGGPCPGDHLDTLQTAQIDHGGTDTAGGAVDINRAHIGAARRFAQQAPGDGVIGNAHRRVEIDPARQRRDDVGGHGVKRGMAAAAGAEYQDRLAERDMAHPGADAGDVAGHFIADHRGQVGHPFIDAGAQQHVGLADAEGMRLDQHLAGTRRGVGQIHVFQDFGPARLGELNRLHVLATFGLRLDSVTPAIITAPPMIWNIEIVSPRSGTLKTAA